MKQHKWHKEIKAWADGKTIEVNFEGEEEWWEDDDPEWGKDNRIYRIQINPIELQPAQEPVAWMLDDGKTFETEKNDYHEGYEWTPLYTHPCATSRTAPPCQECEDCKHDLDGYMEANKALVNREFVGLSDDEILSVLGCNKDSPNVMVYLGIARAIEQALKEKNT